MCCWRAIRTRIPGKWLGRRRVSQDRRRVDRQNPVKKAKKTGIGSGISADDVVGCRGEGEVPPVEESFGARKMD